MSVHATHAVRPEGSPILKSRRFLASEAQDLDELSRATDVIDRDPVLDLSTVIAPIDLAVRRGWSHQRYL